MHITYIHKYSTSIVGIMPVIAVAVFRKVSKLNEEEVMII